MIKRRGASSVWPLAALTLLAAGLVGASLYFSNSNTDPNPHQPNRERQFKSRKGIDPSGFTSVIEKVGKWEPDSSFARLADIWNKAGYRVLSPFDAMLKEPDLIGHKRIAVMLIKMGLLNYEGEPEKSYAALEEARALAEGNPELGEEWLYTVIYFQGITSLRRGETENCVRCRGESSCILPLSPSAVHTNPTGSKLAVKHLTEYLAQFPDDLEVRWLLNVAHMTLGEYPKGVDPRFLVNLDRYNSTEHSIGKFRDVAHLVGLNRSNMAGGIILDDFDNDDRLDLIFTSMDPGAPMSFYLNKGDGTFVDRTEVAGLAGQLGGLNCVQADYDNDGHLDAFIGRGAWLSTPMRPTLLKNNGNGTFRDVTLEAGVGMAVNSDTMQWADFDNDGWLDLIVCNETGPSPLYRNKGDGTFENVAAKAGLGEIRGMWKGCAWFDFNNDGFPDLFLNDYLHDGKGKNSAKLFRNNKNGTFTNVTAEYGIDGPHKGLSCWAWDYDNDGWPDIYATCYDKSLKGSIQGLLGQPHEHQIGRLYRNIGGKRFQDVAREAGLDGAYSSMGTNFGDFDNDGYLDFYLGTGDHDIATLVPNRMFRNLGGKKFADITSSSGTGHLQKGHGVGIGDWDRDGNVDIAIEMGGAIPGDSYHNLLFANPGQGNHWLNVKLVGKKSNRCAIGARIKAVTAGDNPQTVYRYVSSGSSFGANPLEQIVGLGKAKRIATLEVYWPTSGTTQVFKDVPADQAIEITEFATEFRKREYKRIPIPTGK